MVTVKDYILEQTDIIDVSLSGITDKTVKALHFFLKQILGMDDYTINIDINKLEIVITPEKIDTSVFNKESSEEMFSFLSIKLGIPDYTIKFGDL